MLATNASAAGAPPQRPLFFDFPDDPKVWGIDDEFMFGPEWLVAPVVTQNATSRSVYFPAGASWKHHFSTKVYSGGSTAVVPAPLETFPAFTRV